MAEIDVEALGGGAHVGLSVLNADGDVVASTSGRGLVRPMPETLTQEFLELRRETGALSEWGYRFSGDTLYLLLPVRGVDGEWGGALAAEVSGGNVGQGGRFFEDLAVVVFAIVAAGIALLTVFVVRALIEFTHGRPVSGTDTGAIRTTPGSPAAVDSRCGPPAW